MRPNKITRKHAIWFISTSSQCSIFLNSIHALAQLLQNGRKFLRQMLKRGLAMSPKSLTRILQMKYSWTQSSWSGSLASMIERQSKMIARNSSWATPRLTPRLSWIRMPRRSVLTNLPVLWLVSVLRLWLRKRTNGTSLAMSSTPVQHLWQFLKTTSKNWIEKEKKDWEKNFRKI